MNGQIWPPLEPKAESCFSPFSPFSSDWFIRKIVQVSKIWHLLNFYCSYGNKNGRQNRLKLEKLPLRTKFNALGDRLF